MSDLSRRDVLIGSGIALGGYAMLSEPTSSSGGAAPPEDAWDGGALRFERLRPLLGGTSVGVASTDAVGTLAGGIEGPNGEQWALTCRHVVDPDYPDSDESDVIGTDVYQPGSPDDGAEPFGTVVDVGKSKGTGATDWAAIEVTDISQWSSRVLGFGAPAERGQVSTGDRVIMSGLRTGLIGARVTDTGLSTNWKGTLLSEVIEYRVEGDRGTAGNSGAWVGTLDSSGAFRPVGIHAFSSDEYRYAIPVEQCVDGSDASIVSGGEQTSVSADPYVEVGVAELLEDPDTGDRSVRVATVNAGGSSTERQLEATDGNGDVVDTATVSLGGLGTDVLDLDAPDSGAVYIDSGDDLAEAGTT
jgi:hypothetical protein